MKRVQLDLIVKVRRVRLSHLKNFKIFEGELPLITALTYWSQKGRGNGVLLRVLILRFWPHPHSSVRKTALFKP
jgi:hypothetical protein